MPYGRRLRGGFTLTEVMVAMLISGIVALALSTLIVGAYRTFASQMRQSESDWRARQVIASFHEDAGSAIQILYSGTSSYALPALTSPATYNVPSGISTSNPAIPAGTRVVVFQLPSYNSSGIIPGSYDYVGYTWDAPASGAPGQTFRTCIPTTGSSRPNFYGLIPGGGDYDTTVNFLFHVAATYASIDSANNTSYTGNSYADNAPSGAGTYFQSGTPTIGLPYVDQVTIDITVSENIAVSGTSAPQAVSQRLVTTTTLKGFGRGAYSASSTTVTAPNSPTGVVVTSSSGQVSLDWVDTPNATSYEVKRSTTSGGPYAVIASGVTASQYTDTTVTIGTTYYYVITAVNSGGESPTSNQVSATPVSISVTVAAPTNLLAQKTVHRGEIDLGWNQSTTTSIQSNKIYRISTNNGPYTLVTTISANTYYADTGLTSGSTYYYVVTAVNSTGSESAYSNQSSAKSK